MYIQKYSYIGGRGLKKWPKSSYIISGGLLNTKKLKYIMQVIITYRSGYVTFFGFLLNFFKNWFLIYLSKILYKMLKRNFLPKFLMDEFPKSIYEYILALWCMNFEIEFSFCL